MKEEDKLTKKNIFFDYMDKCPSCGSTKLQPLNLYRGMYKKGNPSGKKNQQKFKCELCGEEFYLNIGL